MKDTSPTSETTANSNPDRKMSLPARGRRPSMFDPIDPKELQQALYASAAAVSVVRLVVRRAATLSARVSRKRPFPSIQSMTSIPHVLLHAPRSITIAKVNTFSSIAYRSRTCTRSMRFFIQRTALLRRTRTLDSLGAIQNSYRSTAAFGCYPRSGVYFKPRSFVIPVRNHRIHSMLNS